MGVEAPGKLLLLLATAATGLHHGAATTSSTLDYTYSSVSCSQEDQDCAEDTVCEECRNVPYNNSGFYSDCFDGADPGAVAGATPCALSSFSVCCIDAASDHDCMGNDFYVAYNLCRLSEECAALDCSLIGSGDGVTDDTDDEAGVGGADDYGVLVDTDGQCSVEAQACFDDEECLECMVPADGWDMDELNECYEQYVLDESDVCPYYTKGICCQDAQSRFDCTENAAYVALNLCLSSEESLSLGQGECTTFTCSGDGIAGETDDGDGAGEADAGEADASGAAGVGTCFSIFILTIVLGFALF